MHLTARGYHRVLRVARTIADLDGVPQLRRAHIAEALSFRRIAPERRRVPIASSRPGPVSAGTIIPVAAITAGQFTFTPAAGASGTPYTSFTFQVQDNGGTAGGGVDLDPSPNTMTINVGGLNDPPVGADNAITIVEDNVYTFLVPDFGFTDPNDVPAM